MTQPTREVRYLPPQGVTIETRSVDGKDVRVLSGYAAVYYRAGDPKTEFNMGRFSERLMPGAFDAALAEQQDVRALWNHDTGVVLGRSKSGTLRLTSDAVGLRYEVDLPDTQAARDLATSVSRGDIDGSSFAFQVRRLPNGDPAHTIEKLPDGRYVRSVHAVNLMDISPVTYPAYAATSASVRELEAAVIELEALAAAKDAEARQSDDEEFRIRVAMALIGPPPFVADDI